MASRLLGIKPFSKPKSIYQQWNKWCIMELYVKIKIFAFTNLNEMEKRFVRTLHDGVIKWKHFPRNWPFVWGIHRSPVDSLYNGQRRRALIFSLRLHKRLANNRDAVDLRLYRAHYDSTAMIWSKSIITIATPIVCCTKLRYRVHFLHTMTKVYLFGLEIYWVIQWLVYP